MLDETKINGKYIHALKGKTTRSKPKQVVIDYMEIPKSILECNKNITLSIDIMYVNKIPFVTTISRHVKFTTVEAIQKRTKAQLSENIKNVVAIYTQHTTLFRSEDAPVTASVRFNIPKRLDIFMLRSDIRLQETSNRLSPKT